MSNGWETIHVWETDPNNYTSVYFSFKKTPDGTLQLTVLKDKGKYGSEKVWFPVKIHHFVGLEKFFGEGIRYFQTGSIDEEEDYLTVEPKSIPKGNVIDEQKIRYFLIQEGLPDPKEEKDIIPLFKRFHRLLGFDNIHKIRPYFPDCIAYKDGEMVGVEFEYLASNFLMHKHNPKDCDYIVCWKNNLKDSDKLDLPIIELYSFFQNKIHIDCNLKE